MEIGKTYFCNRLIFIAKQFILLSGSCTISANNHALDPKPTPDKKELIL